MKNLFALCIFSLLAIGVQAQQIDSIVENSSPGATVGNAPIIQIGFNFYVSDTTNIDSIDIKMGYQSGSSDMFHGQYSVSGLSLQYNPTSNAPYYFIYATNNSLMPRYVSAYIRRQDQSVSATTHQRLF